MIKDSTNELMEVEGVIEPKDTTNDWLKFLNGGGAKPRPALEGRLTQRINKPMVSQRQRKGVRYGK